MLIFTNRVATRVTELVQFGMVHLGSAGVGALVSLFVSRRNRTKTLAVTALTKQGTAVLQVAGLTKLLPIFSTVEQALAAQA